MRSSVGSNTLLSNVLLYIKVYLLDFAHFKTNVTKCFTRKSHQKIQSIRTEIERDRDKGKLF